MSAVLLNTFKALSELGLQPVAFNALYRFGLATGHYKRVLNEIAKRNAENRDEFGGVASLFGFPTGRDLSGVIGGGGKDFLIAEADEIVGGKVRLFGGEPVDLNLCVDGPLQDWTDYERNRTNITVDHKPVADIKFIWEPARFGWAFSLGRAYILTGDEKYPEAFWHYFEAFSGGNPSYDGPQWVSGQEAALRLMAFSWAAQAFTGAHASTQARMAGLAGSVAVHANRILPTFIYARSQQNNHLLVEAAGLFTAGLALPEYSQAQKWLKLGWEWLNRGLQQQIDGYGEYAQHSTNYHRLMLHTVLWADALARRHGLAWPRKTRDAITRSIHWLLSMVDPDSGNAPNLGSNDGAYIFPLTICAFNDYRPVLCAAARAFLDYDLPHGEWDELSLWFGIPQEKPKYLQLPRYLGDQVYGKDSWAYLRTAQFTTRPSHADQLHLDMWWKGLNIAQDAGTYLYNADPPWDNSLTTARVHNTVTVNGCDQMTQAGRFLYLDWVNAYRQGGLEADAQILQKIRGRYRNSRLGYRHTRLVTVYSDGCWRVEDELMPVRWLPVKQKSMVCRLQWLLPDWEWQIKEQESTLALRLQSPYGWLTLNVSTSTAAKKLEYHASLARAGELLFGQEKTVIEPTRGWVSPTYGVKAPALSLAFECTSADEIEFVSEFRFP
jgi:hypothetical protein